jgi:hypothetical protein
VGEDEGADGSFQLAFLYSWLGIKIGNKDCSDLQMPISHVTMEDTTNEWLDD